MKIDDIDKEMKEVKASTAAAHKAFQEEDFVTAGKLYLSAAALLQRMYPADHPDTLKCFLLAGDSYYFLERFGEAADTYLKLEVIVGNNESAPVDHNVLYFKTAKALEKAKRFDAAETAYSKALAYSEKTLSENHPLLTIINESYSSFMRHIRKNPAAANVYEERAETLRERNKNIHGLYENYLEPLKKRSESVHSANLHARGDGKSSSQSPAQQIVITPQRTEKADTKKQLKIAAAVVVCFVGLSVIIGLSLRKASEAPPEAAEKKSAPVTGFRMNLMPNGGFEAQRGCKDTPDHPAFLACWQRLRGSVRQTKATGAIGPTDGIQFINLGGQGEISHVFYSEVGRDYTLMIDVAMPAPDKDPVIFYSLDSKNWLPVLVETPNAWHTETIQFKGNGKEMVLTIKAGAPFGISERFVDNVRLYEDASPLDAL